jgi:hypothetical protein
MAGPVCYWLGAFQRRHGVTTSASTSSHVWHPPGPLARYRGRLFEIEREVRGQPLEHCLAIRAQSSVPLLDEFRHVLDKAPAQVSRKNSLAGAIRCLDPMGGVMPSRHRRPRLGSRALDILIAPVERANAPAR